MNARTDMIGVAGDWHGDTVAAFIALNEFKRNNIDTVVHVGDFGIGFGHSGGVFIRKVQNKCAQLGITLYVAPGNHEDYVRIAAKPTNDEGWIVYDKNILLAPRGHRWQVGERSFVFLGGANSIDREWRTPNVSWWKEEQITLGDVYRTVEGGHADIMVTHDCPLGVPLPLGSGQMWTEEGLKYATESRVMLRQAVDGVKPKILLHGHYHMFNDVHATLNDGVEDYVLHSVGLDMNGKPNNFGLLRLSDLHVTMLKP